MKILLQYLSAYKKLIFFALILAAINQCFSLLDPIIFKHVIDDYAAKSSSYTQSEFFKGVLALLGLAIGTAFISRVAKNLQDYYTNVITQQLGAKIYADGLSHSLELPYEVFADQRSGETLSKLQKVRTDAERIVLAAINTVFTTLVGFIFVIIYTLSVHWAFVVVYGLAVPIIGYISMTLGKKIRVTQKRIVEQMNALSGSTTESLRNIELVKGLGLAEQEIERLNSTTNKILKLELEKIKYVRAMSFIQGTVINFIRVGVLFLMMYFVFIGGLTFGEFFSLYIYSFFLFSPLQELGNIISLYRETEVSLDNFRDILAMPKEVTPENPKAIGRLNHVSFNEVGFSYKQATTPALKSVSFEIKQGQTIAFVGPSGSGKTSLVKLLVGLYIPSAGNIFYNSVDREEADLGDLRAQIGFVTQDTQLFAGTIADNLRFVRPKATDEECLEVLRRASCMPLLERAPEGINTTIGEGGVKVSGGERQRLAIARALLRNPSLLIFDEATSALDSLTEAEITKTIESLSGEHMTVLIAHRLSTVIHADKIFVLERGKVIESGKHSQLVDEGGLYYAMWRQQLGEGNAS
jgi:ATP-binding cassette subfamily B protein